VRSTRGLTAAIVIAGTPGGVPNGAAEVNGILDFVGSAAAAGSGLGTADLVSGTVGYNSARAFCSSSGVKVGTTGAATTAGAAGGGA